MAKSRVFGVTICGMGKGDWGDYWRRVCAPKLLAKKKELGRAVPEREIAIYVERTTGKPSERSLVWMWLHGEREPFISQFFALCSKLGIDPLEVLELTSVKAPPGVVRHRGNLVPRVSQKRERKIA